MENLKDLDCWFFKGVRFSLEIWRNTIFLLKFSKTKKDEKKKKDPREKKQKIKTTITN